MGLGGCNKSKQSRIGESCTKSEECEGTSRCIANVCVAEGSVAEATATVDPNKRAADRKHCMNANMMPNPYVRFFGLGGVQKSSKRFEPEVYAIAFRFLAEARTAGYYNKVHSATSIM
jgi:hypothetical protein